jgi:hypothetical protein
LVSTLTFNIEEVYICELIMEPLQQHDQHTDDDKTLAYLENSDYWIYHSDGKEVVDKPNEYQNMKHIFALSSCRQINPAHIGHVGGIYTFQIADAEIAPYEIRMSEFGLQCSCAQDRACCHRSWFLEQLSYAGLTQAGSELDCYKQIAAAGLKNICETLSWQFQNIVEDGARPEIAWRLQKDGRTSVSQFQTENTDPTNVQNRCKHIREMLSVLSTELVENYRPDIFNNIDSIMSKDILVPADLEATLSRLLLKNDLLFFQFEALIPPNLREADVFRKLEAKARQACCLLDEYIQRKPSTNSKQYDLAWCAAELVNIVSQIDNRLNEHRFLFPSTRQEAAKALVSIMYEVVMNRNTDIYQNSYVSARPRYNQLLTDRNLYLRLIGSPSPQNPPGNAFVLTVLQHLPEACMFVENLERIWLALDSVGWASKTPYVVAYRKKLADLIAGFKDDHSNRSRTLAPGKRSAETFEQKIKRMK